MVLADSQNQQLSDTIQFTGRSSLFERNKGYIVEDFRSNTCCLAHALSPGYQTYATGWHSLIIQKLKRK
ncbi:MAG: hypothetical protein EB153_03300 [Nitrosopumilaceae archaeon]|nr:hypothetical protein [Nitrosopumilaceae archaeon]